MLQLVDNVNLLDAPRICLLQNSLRQTTSHRPLSLSSTLSCTAHEIAFAEEVNARFGR